MNKRPYYILNNPDEMAEAFEKDDKGIFMRHYEYMADITAIPPNSHEKSYRVTMTFTELKVHLLKEKLITFAGEELVDKFEEALRDKWNEDRWEDEAGEDL
jgi:hypothetical protein